jgi:hypothetical protein
MNLHTLGMSHHSNVNINESVNANRYATPTIFTALNSSNNVKNTYIHKIVQQTSEPIGLSMD